MRKAENARENRDRIIIRTSVLGILANIALAAFKGTIGLLSNSIAVVLDAVNNLSDALSSVITIVGTKLAAKKPDKKHPLGYGRLEYISAMFVAAIVLYAGITSGVESVKKIISPQTADYSITALVILAAAVLVKLVLGRYVKAVGERVHSGALTASGSDAMFDAVLSFSVLVCALLYFWTHISLEAYVGLVISAFIIKAGVEMLLETLDEILGSRVDRDYLKEIKRTICEDESVHGAYDLILHSYGPDTYVGSVHVEVVDTLTAEEIDTMERRIADRVLEKHGILLVGISIYAQNTRDDAIMRMRTDITHIVVAHEGVMQMHGFYVDRERKKIHMDVVLDFALQDRQAVFDKIRAEIRQAYPDYTLFMRMDLDV